MQTLENRIVVVAGGTGNVGPFIVRALLDRGATVAVPSRSDRKLAELREHLRPQLPAGGLDRLHTFAGDLTDEDDAARVRARITETAGAPDAVIASVGAFVTAPSVLQATSGQLTEALDAGVLAHLALARGFLPSLRDTGGSYMMLQGPLAFDLIPGLGGDLVSIATAAQHMLFRALAQELDGGPVSVVELVIHAFIRDRRTQAGSPVAGDAVGAFAANLLTAPGAELHGRSIHLRSKDQLAPMALA